MKKKEKNHCLICNLNSSKYIYGALLPVSCMFIHFFQNKMFECSLKKNEMLKYNLPLLFYYFLPKLFSVFFILIIKLKTKEETKVRKASRRYHFFIRSKNKKKIYFLIFIISLLEVLYKIDDSLLLYLNKKGIIGLLIEKRIGFIIFVPFFSFILLNIQFYKHHLFAIILALIGSFLLSFFRFSSGLSKIQDFRFHILYLFFSSFFSLALVLIKFVMAKYVIEPYNVLFYDGLFCIINALILVLIEYFIFIFMDPDENFKNYFMNNYYEIINIFFGQNWEFYLFFFLSLIASFCYFVFNILTIFNFSPVLNVLTDFLTPFLLNIAYFFIKQEYTKEMFFYEITGYIMIILGALILNEIIIINICGLSENTYLRISFRGRLEYSSIEDLSKLIDDENRNPNINGNENENENENENDNLTDNDDDGENVPSNN